MDILQDKHIDFMKHRKVFIWVSIFLLGLAVFAELRGDLNLGIDFAGGTQLTLKFQDEPDVERLRDVVSAAGVEDVLIQRFGDAGDNEVIIKTASIAGSEEGSRGLVETALEQEFDDAASAGQFDLNRNGRGAVADLLVDKDPESLGADPEAAAARYDEVAEQIVSAREETGMFASAEEVAAIPDLSESTRQVLAQNTRLGPFTVLGSENVGPQIGEELRNKGIWAVALSLLGMLGYIWVRFELRYGVGALVAVTHDVIITLGLFTLAGFEFNLTTIAAFLTLVGYSVNDSVVVFDRVRENLRRSRNMPLVDVMNMSLNQMLSRTVLTSGTTLLVMGCLLIWGGDVLRGFAFIITVGVVVGTYSSIYVASPFALLWEQVFGREARTRRRETRTA
jgi:preprotein translocase subunit SecF